MKVDHPPRRYPSAFALAIERSRENQDPIIGGHAGSGGLQKHSIGGIYPYDVVPIASGDMILYYAVDTRKGFDEQVPVVFTKISEAYYFARNLEELKREGFVPRHVLSAREVAYDAAERGEW
jgi:hypothetical protein